MLPTCDNINILYKFEPMKTIIVIIDLITIVKY